MARPSTRASRRWAFQDKHFGLCCLGEAAADLDIPLIRPPGIKNSVVEKIIQLSSDFESIQVDQCPIVLVWGVSFFFWAPGCRVHRPATYHRPATIRCLERKDSAEQTQRRACPGNFPLHDFLGQG